MFAYCGNNPVSRTDASGHAFIQVNYNFDDLPNDLFPEIGGGCAGAVAGGATILSGMKHSEDKETRILYEVFEKTVTIDEPSDFLDVNATLNQIKVVEEGKPIVKIISGVRRIGKGMALLWAPMPTLWEDYVGFALVEFGALSVVYGVVELITGEELMGYEEN